jgi:hypothetical protein
MSRDKVAGEEAARMAVPAFAEQKYAAIRSIWNFVAGREAPQFPATVFLEVSNLCDLKCAMCGPFSALSPYRLISLRAEDRGFMSLPRAQLLDLTL